MGKKEKVKEQNSLLKKEIDNEKVKLVVLYLLAFFVPAIILIAVFIYLKIYPFGDNTYMPADAYGQYVNYLQYFRDIFVKGNSIFYSLSKSIGGEMYGLFAYYLMSPYNFITLLFQKGNVTFAFDIILILKMASAGVTFTYYLNRRKKADFKNLFFAMMYVFSAYVLTYGFNIMWLDSIILFPLVIAGLDDLLESKKIGLYIVSLTLTLITNYYMGFMVCLFCIIYVIYKLILGKLNPKKELLKKIGLFIFISIISALIASVILVPALKGLMSGRADFSFQNFNLNANFELKEILAKLFTNSFEIEEIKNESLPPLYVGILANILVILYFLNSKIKLKEKIASLSVMLVFIISFYFNGINTLWTMGNVPAWYRFRYAFMFNFMYILFAKKRI